MRTAMTLLLLASGAVQAAPTMFDTPTSCSTSCSGYSRLGPLAVTSVAVDVNHGTTVYVTIGAVRYSGPAVRVRITSSGPAPEHAYNATINNATLSDGTHNLSFNGTLLVKKQYVRSGKAGTWVTRYWVQNGYVAR